MSRGDEEILTPESKIHLEILLRLRELANDDPERAKRAFGVDDAFLGELRNASADRLVDIAQEGIILFSPRVGSRPLRMALRGERGWRDVVRMVSAQDAGGGR